MLRVLGYRPHLLAIARRRVGCEADAEDAVQEALARALERIDQLDPDRVEGWLTTVTINACRDIGREHNRHGKRLHYQVKHSTPEPYPDEVVAERDYASSVAAAMAGLPEPQQIALQLRAADVPVDEIARTLQLSAKAVESVLSRGRGTMRRLAAGLAVALAACARPAVRRGAGQLAVTATAATACLCYGMLVGTSPAARSDARASHLLPAVDTAHIERTVLRPASRIGLPHGAATAVMSASTPARHVRLATIAVGSEGAQRRKPDQTFTESLQECVRHGVTVSARYVGCAASENS